MGNTLEQVPASGGGDGSSTSSCLSRRFSFVLQRELLFPMRHHLCRQGVALTGTQQRRSQDPMPVPVHALCTEGGQDPRDGKERTEKGTVVRTGLERERGRRRDKGRKTGTGTGAETGTRTRIEIGVGEEESSEVRHIREEAE